MPTTKQRINLSVTADMNIVLQKLAIRDHTSVASKTLELVRTALEIEEDIVFSELVKERKRLSGKLLTHDSAWV